MSKIFGILFAAVHLVLFTGFSIRMHLGSHDAMSGMLWGIWKPVDFPVSLLAYYGFVPTPREWGLTSLIAFTYPYFVHGVLGTVWWYFIPRIMGFAFSKIMPER